MKSNKKLLLDCITKKYFQFSGRANRRELFLFMLCNVLVSFIILGISYFLIKNDLKLGVIIYYIYNFFSMLLVIPSYAIIVRRLHDMSFSGWWLLIASFLIGIIGVVMLIINRSFCETFFPPLCILLFIFTMSFKGTDGANKYGEPTLD